MKFNFGKTNDDEMGSNFIGKAVTSAANKASGQEDPKDSLCPSLTLKQRIIGFAVCTGLGKQFIMLLLWLYLLFALYRIYH